MTKEEIISGLKMSMDLTLFDPSTGEVMEPRQLNDINRTAYEAYKGAIELLEKQPDTTTHDSNVVKKGGNDEDRTSGDCISRQAMLEKIRAMQTYKLFAGDDMILIDQAEAQTELMMLPSAQPDIIRCKDCKYYREYGYVNGKPKFLPKCTFNSIYVNVDDFCSRAERREE